MTIYTSPSAALGEYADLLLQSIVSKDDSILPLAPRYRATENAIPANLAMMTVFRLDASVTEVGATVVDENRAAVVVFANVSLAGVPVVLWARVHVAEGLIDEIEIYHTASRGASGYVLHPEEISGGWPDEWTREVPATSLPRREELEHLGRAIYDTTLEGPASAESCVLMEQGGIVHEYIDFMELMFGEPLPEHAPEDVTEMYGVGLDPFRPHDDSAQVWAVDETAGVVVVIGTVRGRVMPVVTRAANVSAFVPESMTEMHARSILPEGLTGRRVLEQDMPVTSLNTQIWRMFDGRVQGVQMYNFLTAARAVRPWA